MVDRSDLNGDQTIKKDTQVGAMDSHIVDKCVVGEWDEDGFMIDLVANAEEIQRKSLQLQGAFVAFLVWLLMSPSFGYGFLGSFGLVGSSVIDKAGANRIWSRMNANHGTIAVLRRLADLNGLPTKHVVANLRTSAGNLRNGECVPLRIALLNRR